MGVFWVALSAILGALATKFLLRMFLGAGLAYITYTGVSALINNIQGTIAQYLGLTDSRVLYFIDLAQVDTYISLTLSAYLVVWVVLKPLGLTKKSS